MDAVVKYAQSVNSDDEFIVMGDLNADCSYFNEDSTSTLSSNDYYWCIDNSVDTTTKSTDCTYDRIIITNTAISDFTGDSGVFRYDMEYGLTVDETTAISDHYPIYAEFWCKGDTDSATKPTPTPIPSTPSPTPTQAPTLVDSDGDGVPDEYNYTPKESHVQTKDDVKTLGFSAIFAIGSVLAVAFGLRRKR